MMMRRRPAPFLQRRFLCTRNSRNPHSQPQPQHRQQQWNVKQVTKSNFAQALEEIKTHIHDSQFIAVSLQNTGSYSASWHRVLPVDTAETAYCKAKHAVERFQIFQFAVCPFTISSSKVIAHPYNFHLFPRDELRIGMPCYSFFCQSSYLTSMARQGFDFNACIYDGISYVSRSQESAAKSRVGNSVCSSYVVQSSLAPSVADSVFTERIKSRVKYWINACKDTKTKTDEALVKSLRKLILGSEEYESRPCLNIDVCSERQVQLALEMLTEFSDNLVPLLIPAKGGGTQAVRVVLTSSKKDRDLLLKKLQNIEEEENKRVLGFRVVVDLISASQKPVVSHNALNDFAFIHSKFIASLPPTLNEFRCSLLSVFPHILDVNHLMKGIGPVKKATNIPSAISYLKRRFFAPIDMEIPHQAETNEGGIHGNNVLRITQLFAKLCYIQKIAPETCKVADDSILPSAVECYANIFVPCSTRPQGINSKGDVGVWNVNSRKVNSDDLVFLWGFRVGMSAGIIKSLLRSSHEVFSEEFDIQLVDKSCAIVAFSNPGLSLSFLKAMDSGGLDGEPLKVLISEGLKATGYETYQRVCRSGLWEANLADSLDRALLDLGGCLETHTGEDPSHIIWDNDAMIDFDEL